MWRKAVIGKRWLGGFTVTCLTANFSSFPVSQPSISVGERDRGAGFTASSDLVAF
jgi:hypothetical protein